MYSSMSLTKFFIISPISKQLKQNICKVSLVPYIHSSKQLSHWSRYRLPRQKPSSGSKVTQNSRRKFSDSTRMSADHPILQQLNVCNNSNVKIKNLEATEAKLKKIVDGGYASLQVVTDYDHTLTRVFAEDGSRYECSWGVLDHSSLMPKFYRDGTRELFLKFYPIEIDPNLSEEEKIPQIETWYNGAVSLLSKCDVHKDQLVEMVQKANTCMREGVEDAMLTLSDKGVPVLIFSAGMGDVLVRTLDKHNINHPNVKVVSNFFKYDEAGRVDGFAGDMIHIFNKNESSIHDSSYYSKLSQRTNAILLGDSMGDVKMTKGLPESHNVLRIGYLNEKVSERLPAYTEAFDIVLTEDPSVKLLRDLLALLTT